MEGSISQLLLELVSKSGKATPGLGYFWSGVASKAKVRDIMKAAIDIENHTAFHLEAVQTPNI